ncbi:RagB/SusD family nutrient uptake outer membrane protein [Reichenbachiella sp. MALMAid0571]|uniref:RagB/SusD family nutrient uptake outer membrane protein n=1 Tax=Reichenbachiella sp. MALMAid0571 TaxID=3143939 RepID=UPI0032DF5A58
MNSEQTSIKSIIFLIGFFLFTTIQSCDEVLDIEAEGNISGDIYDTQENIERALIGAYYGFGGINDGSVGGELMGGDFTLIPTLLTRRNNLEISWDDVNGSAYSNFMDKNILATNDRVSANWRRAYEVINTLNNILVNIDNVTNASAKSKIQGEALAMRGILYFEMVRLWGGQYSDITINDDAIPLKTEPITEVKQIETPELATVTEIYIQAEQDLTTASTLLESLAKNDVNLSYYACQAYLMRMSLQKRDFEAAEGFANIIINSHEFQLADTPVEAFNNTANSSEDIFAIQQTAGFSAGDRSTGSGLPNYYSSLTESGLGVMRVYEFSLRTPARVNGPNFSSIDLRGVVNTNVNTSTTSADIVTPFYTNILNTSLLSSSKYMRLDRVIPKVRLAEIYLSRAEAIYEKNFKVIDPIALSDLNLVRNRAGLPTLLEEDFLTSFAFYDSLILERKRELLFEGIIFHDLKRWQGKIGTSSAISQKFILPIPQTETDTWGN